MSQKGTAAGPLSASQTITYLDSTPGIHPQKLSNLAIRSGENRQLDVRCVSYRDSVHVNREIWLCSRPSFLRH